jgi:addiction module HigA family antidote
MKKEFTPIHPGEILLEEFLKPMEVSQYQLAKTIGVPARRINEIVHGKRAITPDTGLRLSRAFGLSPSFWVMMQSRHDLQVATDQLEDVLASIEPLEVTLSA